MSLAKKLFPAPLTSAALFALWLLLARSLSLGNVLLGGLLGLAAPLASGQLRLPPVRLKRPWVAARYVLSVAWDVVKSNVEVARGVLGWRWRRPAARFVVVPLELRHPLGLAVLSMVTTIVPGTVWSELAVDRSALLLHVWDARDEAAFLSHFKRRYERPLQEIFE